MKILILLLFPMSLLSAEFSPRVDTEVYKTRKQKPHVADFCQRHKAECDRSGDEVIPLTKTALELIKKVNSEVNQEITFMLDPDQYEKEEFWNIPESGFGDCEDNALEKRRRLAKLGFPRGALAMATGFHKEQLYAHGILLVETDQGTLLLDQDNEKVLLWHETVYGLEAREKVDGTWEYFVQDWLL